MKEEIKTLLLMYHNRETKCIILSNKTSHNVPPIRKELLQQLLASQLANIERVIWQCREQQQQQRGVDALMLPCYHSIAVTGEEEEENKDGTTAAADDNDSDNGNGLEYM